MSAPDLPGIVMPLFDDPEMRPSGIYSDADRVKVVAVFKGRQYDHEGYTLKLMGGYELDEAPGVPPVAMVETMDDQVAMEPCRIGRAGSIHRRHGAREGGRWVVPSDERYSRLLLSMFGTPAKSLVAGMPLRDRFIPYGGGKR